MGYYHRGQIILKRWHNAMESAQLPRVFTKQILMHFKMGGTKSVTFFNWFDNFEIVQKCFYNSKPDGL